MSEAELRFARTVGRRLRDVRVEHDVSVFELAQMADVNADRLKAFENGCEGRTPSLRVLYRIARALGIDARELMP